MTKLRDKAHLEAELVVADEAVRRSKAAFQNSRNSKTMQHSERLTEAYAQALGRRDALLDRLRSLR